MVGSSLLGPCLLLLLLAHLLAALPAPSISQTEKQSKVQGEKVKWGGGLETLAGGMEGDQGQDKRLKANVFMGSRGRRAGGWPPDFQLHHFLEFLRLAHARLLAEQFADEAGMYKRQPQFGFHGARG